ncbi:MAG TPA: hypothetical protein VFI06_14980 [Chitinophagaceae bacterium]|nr:hypothetical protein [Chitinophagaceae bacterium]
MTLFNKYLIKTTDQFNPEYFSSINDEIDSISAQIGHLPAVFKPEIIVSYLKDHSIQNDWIKANPGLATLVASGSLFTGNIESLFTSSRNNPGYRKDFETYLMKKFAELEPKGKLDKV